MVETFRNNARGETLDCLQEHFGKDLSPKTLPLKLVTETSATHAASAKLTNGSVAAAVQEKTFTWTASVDNDSRSSALRFHRPAPKRPRSDDRSSKTRTSERERLEARLIGNELQEIEHRLFRFELASGTDYGSKRLRESVAAFGSNRSAQRRSHIESSHDDSEEDPVFVESEPQRSSKSPQPTMKGHFPPVSIPRPSTGSSPPPELFELRWEPRSPQQEMTFRAGTAQENSDLFSWYCA